jgi:hypothetical protein
MRLIVDIPDYVCCDLVCHPDEIVKAIRNATPIPNNATNGDVFEMLIDIDNDCIDVHVENGKMYFSISQETWNAPYKKGGTE